MGANLPLEGRLKAKVSRVRIITNGIGMLGREWGIGGAK